MRVILSHHPVLLRIPHHRNIQQPTPLNTQLTPLRCRDIEVTLPVVLKQFRRTPRIHNLNNLNSLHSHYLLITLMLLNTSHLNMSHLNMSLLHNLNCISLY